MPVYTYRREDGTTFDIRQKFLDEPLESCPTTGQKVTRVVQAAGVIFKGSGFYVTDNKGVNPARPNGSSKNGAESNGVSAEAGSDSKAESKPASSDAKSESKSSDTKSSSESVARAS